MMKLFVVSLLILFISFFSLYVKQNEQGERSSGMRFGVMFVCGCQGQLVTSPWPVARTLLGILSKSGKYYVDRRP